LQPYHLIRFDFIKENPFLAERQADHLSDDSAQPVERFPLVGTETCFLVLGKEVRNGGLESSNADCVIHGHAPLWSPSTSMMSGIAEPCCLAKP
jgi:hypothetical protein